jgi:hypothetical protein
MYSNLVSIEVKSDNSPISKMLSYLGITLAFQFVGFITTFVYSSYFGRTSTFAESFVFQSPDFPPTPDGFLKPQPFGYHFFGDYLWVYAEIKNNGLGGYFGVSQLFLLVATKLSYYLSLIFLLAIVVLLLFACARLLLNELGLTGQLALLIGGVLFTQPVLLAIDRGQMHLLLFALLLLGLTLSIRNGGNRVWGAILIAAAISIKLTPVFFLLLFVKKRCWREFKIAIVSLIGFMVVPLAYLPSGFGAWKFILGLSETNKAQQQMYNSAEYFTATLAYNNSFKLLGYHFSQVNSTLGKVSGFIYDNYFLCAGLLSIFLGWLIVQKSVTQFESVLLMVIASSLLIPIASGYTLMLFILPIVVVLADKNFVFSRLNISYCCYIGIILMPKQMALGFRTFAGNSITLGGILNPGLSLVVILFIAGKCFSSRMGLFSTEAQNLTTKI